MSGPLLGAVADDLTGACDLAGGVSECGMSTVVVLGTPPDPRGTGVDCIVVALKSRTVDPSVAVASSIQAARWLLGNGARILYQKYCSTFDSTARGNIGPVADALARLATGTPAYGSRPPRPAMTVGTPATPDVGRTQYQGHLFVGDRLLSESSLRNHPLTPMRDSDLVRVLGKQTKGRVDLIRHETVSAGVDAIRAELARCAETGAAHVLVDAIDDDDLDALVAALPAPEDPCSRPLVVGGAAGVGVAIARRFGDASLSGSARKARDRLTGVVPDGRRLILSGSCSSRTQEQVAAFDGPTITVDPIAVARGGSAALDDLWADVVHACEAAERDAPVLVSATASPQQVDAVQAELGIDSSAELVERVLSLVAVKSVRDLGVSHLIVAGGETSGAVAAALDAKILRVGALAARGVPWMVSVRSASPIALLLKSGNFGEADLFTTAWECQP